MLKVRPHTFPFLFLLFLWFRPLNELELNYLDAKILLFMDHNLLSKETTPQPNGRTLRMRYGYERTMEKPEAKQTISPYFFSLQFSSYEFILSCFKRNPSE